MSVSLTKFSDPPAFLSHFVSPFKQYRELRCYVPAQPNFSNTFCDPVFFSFVCEDTFFSRVRNSSCFSSGYQETCILQLVCLFWSYPIYFSVLCPLLFLCQTIKVEPRTENQTLTTIGSFRK